MFNKSQYERYFTFDEPIPYADLVKIYPVKVKDYYDFYNSVNCIMIEKNKIPDVKIIQMSYLDFIRYLIENDQDGEYIRYAFAKLMQLCLHVELDKMYLYPNEQNKTEILIEVDDNQIILNKDNFNVIKDIIIYQNIPDYDDTYIDPRTEAALKEAQEFMNRNQAKMCGFEDQLLCIQLVTGFSIDEIYNLSLRKFSKILGRYNVKQNYEICKTGEMSGMVSFKTPITHWMSEIKHQKYDDVIAVEVDVLKNKIESVH